MSIEDFLDWHIKEKEKEDNGEFQIKPGDSYERTWACRDFELSHLWQRSVFLAVFLIAIAGAYGSLIMSMYFPDEQNFIYVWTENSEDKEKSSKKIMYEAKPATYQQHAIATGVCWLGISFSILWVMMAKGSKYWFERYELGICLYEDAEVAGEILYKNKCPHHGNMKTLPKGQYNENIFSPKAGHYSVSKINGTIGIIALTAFSFLTMFHFGKFLKAYTNLHNLQCAFLTISHWLFFGAILLSTLRFLCKSNHNDEEEKSNE